MRGYRSAFEEIENFAKEINKNESDTTQKDMVKNPSHYQGKFNMEVFDVIENFFWNLRIYLTMFPNKNIFKPNNPQQKFSITSNTSMLNFP